MPVRFRCVCVYPVGEDMQFLGCCVVDNYRSHPVNPNPTRNYDTPPPPPFPPHANARAHTHTNIHVCICGTSSMITSHRSRFFWPAHFAVRTLFYKKIKNVCQVLRCSQNPIFSIFSVSGYCNEQLHFASGRFDAPLYTLRFRRVRQEFIHKLPQISFL